MPHEAGETTTAAAVAPLNEGEIHPRRRLLSSTGAGGRPMSRSSGGGAGGPSLLDRLNHCAGNTKLALSLLISIVTFSYFSEEYVTLSVSTCWRPIRGIDRVGSLPWYSR